MTDNQLTELQVANYVCDELREETPFDLILNQDELVLFMEIIDASKLTVGFPVKNIGDNTHIGVTKENFNALYDVFSNYILKHDKFGVVDSLGEVS